MKLNELMLDLRLGAHIARKSWNGLAHVESLATNSNFNALVFLVTDDMSVTYCASFDDAIADDWCVVKEPPPQVNHEKPRSVFDWIKSLF